MPDSAETLSVNVIRLLKAPPQRVFDAWVDPAQRMAWWCAEPGMICDVCEIDARLGGSYRINMKTADLSKEYIMVGEFLEFDPPYRLVFTWVPEHATDLVEDTSVTVNLRAVDGGTELTLTHKGFISTASRDDHHGGWTGCLESLVQFFDRHE